MKKNGFSLIEIIIAIGLSGAILASVFTLFSLSRKSYYQTMGSFENRQNARIAFERISRDLRQTEELVTPLPPIKDDPNNPPPNHIFFQDGHDTSRIKYIEYRQADDKIYKKTLHYSFESEPDIWVHWNALGGAGQAPRQIEDSNQLLAQNISTLSFWGSKIVSFSLSTKSNASNYFETKVLGRNIQ